VDRLDQLFARSQREIQAHTDDLGDTETGRYFIDEAAHLLAALRLWAQSQYRSDQVVREILDGAELAVLGEVAYQLREIGGHDAKAASAAIAGMARLPSTQVHAIAAYARRAL
jgi:hypothetical protein